MAQLVAPSFLGCWALIILALVICFQQDDHHILLDAMAHLEIDIFPFHVILQDTQALLP
jgi:hypothetical protein